jgi:hypothetical protein
VIQGLKREVVKHRGPKQKMQEFACQAPLSKSQGKRRQGPTCSSTETQEDARSFGKQDGAKTRQNGPRTVGLGSRPGPFRAKFGAPFNLVPLRLFIVPMPSQATHQLIRHSSPRSREERDIIPERRGSRWLTRASLADVGTLNGIPRRSSRS